ncbi:Holliday junction DNA helicase RuvA [Salimicrobium jeotgali]|uniref:Holliday junction branch migration complex subunit RuvA n=1 Tax=Salimicrobium jeotgali TaxID=1230341 RepID=K2GD60_9BACI|nr:Holliday junction branch migration protein RuvA [Salimicrobium jeotgali]AKG04220.1 Holliday junction DNA helicase RuvA [Salimicrobium jeotgali]EKE32187.1 Holliday junction ATP-dependent DNA helicase RuvA [Salimicrobium jeotgali]MBM7695798.1 Holliday junction DNA helicase RuvA [Salimicrobium jeotgali]
MIAYVKGTLTAVEEETINVEVQGLGYEVYCANPFYFETKLGEEVKIYTYHHVREDAQILFGFPKKEDKRLFARLLSVSGIGPKGALAILGGVSVSDFISAIEREDDKYLTKFPGVGKKTARQMILDLKGKLVDWLPEEENEATIFYTKARADQSLIAEALEALEALGYSDKELKSIKPELQTMEADRVDDYVRQGLQLLLKT